MRREWLKPFALGVLVASLASIGGWLYNVSSQLLVLTYVKDEGLYGPKLPSDPAPNMKEPTEYLIRIARRCGIHSYSTINSLGLDSPYFAELSVPLNEVSDKQFNCLAKFSSSPRVTIKLKTI
jgi:hypothetical protein